MAATPRWPKIIGDAVTALSPLLGAAILAYEAFVVEGQPRVGLLAVGIGLLGLPLPAWLDRRSRGGGEGP